MDNHLKQLMAKLPDNYKRSLDDLITRYTVEGLQENGQLFQYVRNVRKEWLDHPAFAEVLLTLDGSLFAELGESVRSNPKLIALAVSNSDIDILEYLPGSFRNDLGRINELNQLIPAAAEFYVNPNEEPIRHILSGRCNIEDVGMVAPQPVRQLYN